MQIRTTARHFDLTEDLKNHAQKEIRKLERYFDHIIDCHLILDSEKNRITAELTAKVYGTVLSSKHRSYDIYSSIEKVIGKMGAQLKKYKSKLKDKKAKEALAFRDQTTTEEAPEEEGE